MNARWHRHVAGEALNTSAHASISVSREKDRTILQKRVVLNRKNSLFVGNARGGRTAAILASLTSSCRRHEIDPLLYLTQLLVNLPSLRISDLPDWLPDRWKAAENVRLTGFAQKREFAR